MLRGPFVVSTHAEGLEERCVMTSPSFISVSPNTGVFLSDGANLTEAPRELTFQFSPNQILNANTLEAIHVVGAGYDGQFTPANVVTDLGVTAALITSVTGNTVPIDITTATNHGLSTGNQVTISGVLGNTNANGPATITVLSPTTFRLDGKTGNAAYLGGGAWSLTNGNAILRLGVTRLGPDDNGTTLTVNVAATGNGPSVTLPGGNLTLTLDSVTGTTAQDLLDYLATNATAKRFLSASLLHGDPDTNLATAPGGTLTLSGAGAASGVSDFGASGLHMFFTANQPGLDGNDISIQVNRLDLSSSLATPRINVVGKRIEVTLNENASAPTTAQVLADAINTDAAASLLVRASIPVGVGSTSLANVTDGTMIRLSGADRVLTASALAGFRTTGLQMQFASKTQGIGGNAISLLFNQGTPGISVTGKRITITLNASSTPNSIISLITGNTAANALISAKVVSGSGTTTIPTTVNNSLVQLGGADPAVAPGYRGLEANNREVTYRFASPIGNDTYRFEVIGTGSSPLTNITSEAVNNGQDTFMNVSLDLGATVTGVVPQPVLRQQFIDINSVATLNDGDTITIDPGTGGALYTFEIQDTGEAPSADPVRSGNFAININKATATTNDVASAIVSAITTARSGNPNLTVTATASLMTATSPARVSVVGDAFDVRVKTNLLNTAAMSQRAGGIEQRRDLVNVYFNEDGLNPTLAQDIRFYQLVDTNGTLSTSDDRILIPTGLVYNSVAQTTTLDFGSDLPTATYKLQVGDSDESNNLLTTAVDVGSVYSSADYHNVGFIGDAGGDVDYDLYKVEVATNTVLTVTVQPGSSLNSYIRLFSNMGSPVSFANSGANAGDQDQLVSTPLPAGTYYVGISNSVNLGYVLSPTPSGTTAGGTTGTYQLTIHSDVGLNLSNDNNSSFATATNLGALASGGLTLASQIQPQNIPLPPPAGGPDEPGHREIPAESHGVGPGTTPVAPVDNQPGNPIGAGKVVSFYFPVVYGRDGQGADYINEITEDGKQRTREIFEMYASLYGFEVQETTGSGIGVVSGTTLAVDPNMPPNAAGGIAGGGLVVMNSFVANGGTGFTAEDYKFGGGWMGIALHEIGHAIGLLHSYDIRSDQGNGVAGEDSFPGNNDIVHGRRISPNNGTDIDLYQFTVTSAGVLSAEIVAERLASSSLLNSALKLYRLNLDGTRTLVAQNDDYYSNDAYIELELTAGTYFIGVSSTGNTDYDPTVSDTGFNGTSEGLYQLKLDFTVDAVSSLKDATGKSFDGNADGVAGDAYEFAFRSDSTLYVDKTVVANLTTSLNPTQTTIPVNSLTPFPTTATPNFTIKIDNETMTVTAIDPVNKILTVQTRSGGVNHALGAAVRLGSENGSLTTPFGLISSAVAAATPGQIIRVVGNGGADNDLTTVQDNRAYLLGVSDTSAILEDGSKLEIPKDVVLQVDAGAILKLVRTNVDAGTSAVLQDRSGSALQVLGTPLHEVYFTSYENDLIGGDNDGATDGANANDWGGLVFRSDSDFIAPDAAANPFAAGIFLNYVNHASISYGGGTVGTNTFQSVHVVTTRPTLTNNTITNGAGAAISADPDSFDDSRDRIGPDMHGNLLYDNTKNGVFLRITFDGNGNAVEKLTKTARFDDTDVVHIITQTLEIVGNPGGPLDGVARPSGRLAVDPGVVVKLKARIEGLRGNSHLIAEGTSIDPVIFTSEEDDRFGAGGTFDTGNNQATVAPAPGDWAGLDFFANSRISIDQAYIAYAGGNGTFEGQTDRFNAVEIHHGVKARIANTTFENNATGAGGDRNGRGSTSSATIFVRQAQPILLNNVFRNNSGAVVDINANAMLATFQRDTGRSTGAIDDFEQFADNHGPLIRLNRMSGNGTNGLNVRGDILTTESVWDDTDIVHVLTSEIRVDQHHTYSGLRLQSNPGESLVVKLFGANAGFTADGILLDIDDRIGGTVQVLGQPGFPVVLTSLRDDYVGASLDPDGFPQLDTNNDGIDIINNSTGLQGADGIDDKTGLAYAGTRPGAGNWRSLRFTQNSNDRNVRTYLELEDANNNGVEINHQSTSAQYLGELAPQHVTRPTTSSAGAIDEVIRADGDDNKPLGFEVHGFISMDDPGDVDLYKFKAKTGTEIWVDLDRTRGAALDPVIELVQEDGTVLARARYDRANNEIRDLNDNLQPASQQLMKFDFDGGDFYTFNPFDTGFRFILPGNPNEIGEYFVRVRSNQATNSNLNDFLDGGLTRGEYQLQIRLRQVDEKPGSVVRYADIRFPTDGIDVSGLPRHSPLMGESGETSVANGPTGTPQALGNLLNSDRNVISVNGTLSGGDDQDFFVYNSDYAATILGDSIQVIGGVSGGGKTWSTVFDVDYADGLTRGDTTLVVYSASGVPILIGRESNVEDDRPAFGSSSSNPNDTNGDLDDLSRGSVGFLDPFIGPVQMPTGNPGQTTNYQLAVSSNRYLIQQLEQTYDATPTNMLTRLEPVNSSTRIIEDHIGYQGYGSNGKQVDPSQTTGLFTDISSAASLSAYVRPFDFGDVTLYLNQGDALYTYNPLFGQRTTTLDNDLDQTNSSNGVTDIVMRSDGRLWAYRRSNALPNANSNTNNSTAGAFIELETGITGTNLGNFISNVNDGIPSGSPGSGNAPGSTNFEQVTNTDDADALAFRRNDLNNYELYYSVRENGVSATTTGANTFNSKLYRADPATGSAALGGSFGIRGDIQLSGTNPGAGSQFFSYSGASGTLAFQTRAQGTQVNDNPATTLVNEAVRLVITMNAFNGAGSNAVVTGAANGVVTVQVNYNSDPALNSGAGAAVTPLSAVVDAVNSHASAQQIMTAVVSSGNAGTLIPNFGTTINASGGSDDASGRRIHGTVTGLAFGTFTAGTLYGVTSGEGVAGRGSQLISINTSSGNATIIRDFSSLSIGTSSSNGFQGLALGPQNVSGGIYANSLFAVTQDGRLVAFDPTTGNGVIAFDSNNEVQTVSVTGTPTAGSFFTLTFNNQTTDPIAYNAPGAVSYNEFQTADVVAYAGTYTLSLVNNLFDTTSPVGAITSSTTSFQVEDATGLPASGVNFVIKIGDEEMLVNRTGTTTTLNIVTRDLKGTAADLDHNANDALFEVLTTNLNGALLAAPSSQLTGNMDNVSDPVVIDVADSSVFPAAGTFTIRIGAEEMLASVGPGANQLTVNGRGQNGTTVASHSSSATVSQVLATQTITVDNIASFPTTYPFNIRVGTEDMRVTGSAAGQFTVVRGINGTTIATHNDDDLVYRLVTTAAGTLSYNSSASQVASAIVTALTTAAATDPAMINFTAVAGTDVIVTPSTSSTGSSPASTATPLTIEFAGTLGKRDVFALTGDRSSLEGDERQTLTLSNSFNNVNTNGSGTYTLSYGVASTGPLNFGDSAAVVEAALNGLSTIGGVGGAVTITGTLPGTMTVQFRGTLQDQDVAQIGVNDSGLTNHEVQQFQLNGAPTGGNFTLNLTNTTPAINVNIGPINHNASLLEIQNAFTAALGANAPTVTMSQPNLNVAGAVVTVVFENGTLADVNLTSTMTLQANALTGGTSPTVIRSTSVDGNLRLTPATTRAGSAVSIPVSTTQNGNLSVYDALERLTAFTPTNILVTGGDLPGTAVGVTFIGMGDVSDLIVENGDGTTFGMLNGSLAATATTGTINDRVADSFIVSTGSTGFTGLAFSPLDFNLWHPTTTRGNDAGHGINTAYDNSRTPSAESRDITDGDGNTRTQSEQAGGTSFYFGLDEYSSGSTPYLNYEASNTQLGILNNQVQRDLTSNAAIGTNYNLPGGAYGSLITNPFDLTSSTGAETNRDRPTLYFNYFLASEDTNVNSANSLMRDSARVFVSTDGGATWNLLTTNNAPLNANGIPTGSATTEIPHFISHSSLANNGDPRQDVQALFDNTGSWRQARVDLSEYVGQTGLVMRFDFSTAGTIIDAGLTNNDPTLATPQDGYGDLQNSSRSTNNNHEGFYIDDIIIGWSERGEMITAATADKAYFSVPQAPGSLMLPAELLVGGYQVEIRRGFEYGANKDKMSALISVNNTFDTNTRFIPGYSLGLPSVSDDFEAGDADQTTFAVNPAVGWDLNSLASNVPWFAAPTPFGATTLLNGTLGATPLNTTIMVDDASIFPAGTFILFVDNEPMAAQVLFGNTIAVFRSSTTATTHNDDAVVSNTTAAVQSGPIVDNQQSAMQANQTTSGINFDYKVTADTGDQFLVYVDELGGESGPVFVSGDTGGAFQNVTINVTPGIHTFFFVYRKDGTDGPDAVANAIEGAVIDNIVFQGLGATFIRGDRNQKREQGHFQIENNYIRNAFGTGIRITGGTRDATTNASPLGSPINFRNLNAEKLAPGITVANNVIQGFGTNGIHFTGDSNAATTVPSTAVPFGKLINNTIYGAATATGTGIRVEHNASPTLLNNLIANTVTGIIVDASSALTSPSADRATVINRTFFHGNTTNTAISGLTASNSIIDPIANPLFVAEPNQSFLVSAGVKNFFGNFYLRAGSGAIDRSLGSLADRNNFNSFKDQMLIPASNALSPELDLYGQVRKDDTLQGTSGLNGEVFNDLGAIERADLEGGVATLIVPEDGGNDDLNGAPAVVHVDNPPFFNQFVVKLTDTGLGIDDSTVTAGQFVLTQTTVSGTVTLLNNVDYIFSYNANTNEAIFTSVTLFPQDARYELTVNNSPTTGILDYAGNPLTQNQTDGTVSFDGLITNGVNDPPVNSVPLIAPITENTLSQATSVALSQADGTAISVTDPDAFIGTNTVEVTLTAQNGTFTLPADPALLSLVTINSSTSGSGLLAFSGATYSVNETGTSVLITVTRTGGSAGTVSVNYATSSGTATSGSDFTAASGTLTWLNGDSTAKTFLVSINNDVATEGNESFNLSLSNPTGSANLGTSAATVSIVDNEFGPGVLSFSSPTYTVAENGTSATITVNRTGGSAGVVTVNYQTVVSGSTAGAGSDYTSTAGVLTFADSQTSRTFTIPITNDVATDPNETVNLSLTSPSGGATLGSSSAVLTILDDESGIPGVLSFSSPTYTQVEGGASFVTITVTRTVGSTGIVTVNYATGGGSATAGSDYTSATGTLTWAGSDSAAKTFTIPILNDGLVESNETIGLTLSGVTGGATLGTSTATLQLIDDDSNLTSVKFTGSIPNINTFLAGGTAAADKLTFTPTLDYNSTQGVVRLEVHANDLGNTGPTLAPATDTDYIVFTVNAANSTPLVIAPANISVNEDDPAFLTFSRSSLANTLNVTDPDRLDGPVDPLAAVDERVTITVTNGVFSLGTTAGLTFFPMSGSNDGIDDTTMTFEGTLAELDAALNNLVYKPNANFAGAATMAITINDKGNTPTGGPQLTNTKVVNITVNPQNDPPTRPLTSPTTHGSTENAGPQTANLTFGAFSPGGGADEASQTFAGFAVTNDNNPLFSVQPAISTAGVLTYTAAPNANGTANLQILVHDSVGAPYNPAQTAIPFTITVGPANSEPFVEFDSNPNTVTNPLIGNGTRNEAGDNFVYRVEDAAGVQTVGSIAVPFVTFNPGAPDEAAQTRVGGYAVNVLSTTRNLAFTLTGAPTIDANGVLTFELAPNTSGDAVVEVTVMDNGGTSPGDDTGTRTFTISVAEGNADAPVATTDTYYVKDNAVLTVTPAGVLANDVDPDFGAMLEAFLDSGPTQNPGLFTLNANGSFTYDHNGAGADSFQYHAEDRKTPINPADVSGPTTVNILVNNAPTFTGGTTGPFSVNENSPGGTAVGDVDATDPDGHTLLFSVTGGTGMGLFQIDPGTGAITVAPGANLDYETLSTYSLTVQINDQVPYSQNYLVTTNVTINLNDVKENIVIGPGDFIGFTDVTLALFGGKLHVYKGTVTTPTVSTPDVVAPHDPANVEQVLITAPDTSANKLTINFFNGQNPFPTGVTLATNRVEWAGGAGTFNDTLSLINGGTLTGVNSVVHNFTSASDGTVVVDASYGVNTVSYTQLEPATGTPSENTDSLTATNRTFNFTGMTADNITLTDDTSASNGLNRLSSLASSLSWLVKNPTGTAGTALTVNAGDGSDIVNLLGLDTTGFAAGRLTVNGDAGSDKLFGRTSTANAFVVTDDNDGILNLSNFDSFESLAGGSAADSFVLNNGKGVLGTIDGGTGTGMIDSLSYVNYTTPVGITISNATTGTGDGNNIGSFLGIESVIGTSGTDLITGPNTANTWNITGNQIGNIGGTLSFSGFEYLKGNGSTDLFKFSGSGAVSNIEGGTGVGVLDTLDWSSMTARNVVLGTVTTTLGFSGSESLGTVGIFTGIDFLIGGGGNDTLTGNNATTANPFDAEWEIDGSNRYSNTDLPTQFLGFSSFENLVGGSGDDRFTVSVSHPSLSGGAGDDSFVLTSTGTVSAIDGGSETDTYDLSGKTSAQTINLSALTNIETLIGGASVGDTLVGAAGGTNFNVSGLNSGNVGTLNFSGIENLQGAAGTDTLSFSVAQAIVLTAVGTTDGFRGTTTSLTGGFNNINVLAGSAASDSVKGLNTASTWTFGAGVTYKDNVSTRTINIQSGIETLLGGTVVDTFVLNGLATSVTHLDGGNGTDVLSQTVDANQTLSSTTITSGALNLSHTAIESAVLTVSGTTGRTIDASGVTAPGLTVTLTGSSGPDILIGGANNDSVDGLGGSDRITGGLGNDILKDTGTTGTDTLVESANGTQLILTYTATTKTLVTKTFNGVTTLSTDTVLTGFENASLTGGAGDDIITANPSPTTTTSASIIPVTLVGGGGHDKLTGGNMADLLLGEAGNDVLVGGSGNDTINGGDDNDTITGGLGQDSLIGGNGGTNVDVLLETGSGVFGLGVNGITTATSTATTLGNDTSFTEFEGVSLAGGTGNDTITVNAAVTLPVTLNGGAGADVLTGGSGKDVLIGGSGNDMLNGGGGLEDTAFEDANVSYTLSKTQLTGNGTDTFVVVSNVSTVEKVSIVIPLTTTSSTGVVTTISSPNTFTLSTTAPFLGDGISGTTDVTLNGGNGNDVLVMSGAIKNLSLSNTLLSGVGTGSGVVVVVSAVNTEMALMELASIEQAKLTITGTAGGSLDASGFGTINDAPVVTTSFLSTISASLTGGSGNDTIYGSLGRDLINGGLGNDKLDGNESPDSMLGAAGHDKLRGGDGKDTLDGGDGNDTLSGEEGDDSLLGGTATVSVTAPQSDVMSGGNGNDTLKGGTGNDTLLGDAGLDNLSGETGVDLLIGGADADVLDGGGTATEKDKLDDGADANAPGISDQRATVNNGTASNTSDDDIVGDYDGPNFDTGNDGDLDGLFDPANFNSLFADFP